MLGTRAMLNESLAIQINGACCWRSTAGPTPLPPTNRLSSPRTLSRASRQTQRRVDVQGDDQLWRFSNASNVQVRAVVFVKLSLFDSIGESGLDYKAATRLLSMC